MKNHILIILILLFVISVSAQHHPNEPTDTLKITLEAFNKKIANWNYSMTKLDTLKVENAIDMLRMYNTLDNDSTLYKQEIYHKYIILFETTYFLQLLELLEIRESIGMSLYSQKYNLYIYGPRFHINSRYIII